MSFSQGNIILTNNQKTPAPPIPNNVAVLDLVTDIATFKDPNIKALFVKDQVRGGNFLLYEGAQTDDQGIIFTDGLGRLWKRVIESDFINIQWFGAIGVTAKQFDSLDAFNRSVIAGQNRENIASTNIYIPATASGTKYYFSDTVIIDYHCNIFGDGINNSVIIFQENKTGFVFNYITSRYSTINNFSLTAFVAASPDVNAHGFDVKECITLENISAANFGGNGFNMVNGIPNGNSNNCIFKNCLASQNRLHGFYIQGSDANNMRFIGCNATSNGGLGFYDSSFLGNSHTMWHLATNGGPDISWQRGLVSDGGNVFQALQDNFSGHPTSDADYWANIGNAWISFPNILPYNPATVYYRAGSFASEGLNQYGAMINCYMEADQAPGYVAPNTLVFSGVNASGVNGVYLYAAQSSLILEGGQFKMGRIFTSPRVFLDNGLIGFGQASGSDIKFSWDDTFKGIALGLGNKLFGPTTTAANEGRTNLITNVLGMFKGFLMSLKSARTVFKLIDIDSQKPTSPASYDAGDMILMSFGNPEFLSEKPEVILSKRVSIPSVQFCRIVGHCEYELSSTNATATQAFYDQFSSAATNQNIKYDIDVLAYNSLTGDVFSTRNIYIVFFPDNATNISVKNTINLESYSDASMAACAASFLIAAGNKAIFNITGIAATTINWKVQVRRIVL